MTMSALGFLIALYFGVVVGIELSKPDEPVWHDLRKDQKDLPDNSRYVWTNVGAGYHDDDGWWDDYGRLQDVIAWCEPKFEEDVWDE